jgi:hypothetical protein
MNIKQKGNQPFMQDQPAAIRPRKPAANQEVLKDWNTHLYPPAVPNSILVLRSDE